MDITNATRALVTGANGGLGKKNIIHKKNKDYKLNNYIWATLI